MPTDAPKAYDGVQCAYCDQGHRRDGEAHAPGCPHYTDGAGDGDPSRTEQARAVGSVLWDWLRQQW
jgi:hypothetical protein